MSKSKPNSSTMKPKPPSLTTLTNSIMSQNQLIDDLTAHISLYHSQSLSSSNPNNTSTTSNHRSNIIKWFSSLAVHQRQAYLTTVDHNFLNLLVQMLSKLRKHGHGRFIILPDLPSRGGLPGLCFKKLSGLLFRVAESNESERLVFESVLLFGSREGERENDCLDSLMVREEFVENVSEFVEVMDKVSNGGFLRGEDSELGSDWVELEWLKARGYYTMEAFVANRLEVSLRLAWLNSCNGKKRGVKLKEKVAAASVAANVFWRKKGGVDWWRNLDDGTREKFFKTVLGKSAKLLTHEVLKNARNATEDEMWMFKTGAEQSLRYINADLSQMNLFKLSSADADFGLANKLASLCGKADSLSNACNSLFVLNDVVGLMSLSLYSGCDTTKVFFSTLGSVNTISDCILRKLRGFVMVISLDCTKLELLGEGNMKSLPNKQKGKSGSGTRRKKGKHGNMKRQSQIAHNIVEESSDEKPCKGLESTSISAEKIDLMETNGLPAVSHGTEIHKEIPTLTEHSKELVVGKGRMVSKKNKKGKTKNKSSRCKNPDEMRNPEGPVAPDAFLVFDSDEPAKLGEITDDLSIQSSPNNETLVTLASNASARSSADQTAGKDINAHTVEDRVVAAAEKMYHTGPENHKSPKNLSKKQAVPSSRNILNSNFPGSTASCRDSVEEIDKGSTNKDHQKVSSESDSTSKHARALDIKKESNQRPQLNTNFYSMRSTSPSEFVSYEWPSLTPVYFPSLNPHLPPATDRLHLDVGLNWQNHIRQPFVPNVHQARNSPIEAGCNGVLSRPPMSLDWPPMVRSICGLAPSLTCTYDSGFISRRKSVFGQSFTGQRMHLNAATDDEAKYSGEFMDMPDGTDGHEGMDEGDGCWIQEEDFELHSVSGIDYNQYFGGGVMYWNPSDYLGSGFSRPPSLSSDDSSWAWHEADMNRAVDDMVAFSSSYSTTGLTSPTAASFCSPFEALSYVVPGNEGSGKVLHPSSATTDAVTDDELTGPLANLSGDTEGKPGDSLAYPILRPIIIPNMSTSEIKRPNDITSPCVRASRREQPRIKRPPSPVVLCVPRAPRPPPPSPVSDSRKHRGFPTVRSGSSSPRHWGVKGWYNDATSMDEACVRVDGTEVFWPSWRNKNVPTCPIVQPLTGALLQDHLIAISQLSRDQEHPDVLFPLQPPEPESCPTRNASISLMHNLLHEEIDNFWKQVAAANMVRKPFISWAVKRVTRSLQVLWPRSRANVFGSNATGLSLPTSDVDLVVCLPPVRNLEPIKEAGILEGRNGIKETCLQHAARYLANQEWVKSDSLKTVENTAIPIIMLVVEVPNDFIAPVASIAQSPPDELMHRTCKQDHVPSDMVGLEDSTLSSQSENNNTNNNNQNNMKDVKSVRLDISFKSPSHTGLQTTELVKELTEQFPAVTPLALVLKKFLADRSLDQSYSGGLSSYCLVLLITRFLQHEHHLGRPINQNWGSLLMDFLYFFGNVFDPRQMRISVQGSGVYINRERGHSIDPIHIDDPLCPTNNVGRNCFRIHQCIKAFSEAYSILGSELANLPVEGEKRSRPLYTLLSKIIPSIHLSSQTRISEEVKPV